MLPKLEELGVRIKSGEEARFPHPATWVELLFPLQQGSQLAGIKALIFYGVVFFLILIFQ